ncbi:MAG: 50S ribosomal protein L25 [Actinomycetota bacterium]|jgi:large subunit ribosomal protein L25|nr:50S ribosomal protein L25 [Actinomycetota bacterium]MDA8293984.1 50S ribosomal protein L25 [Actinomycetota bacterium]
MPEITLAAEVGRTTGSSATRRLRAEGKIPGVLYGHGIDPVPLAVDARAFRTAMSGEAGLNTLLSLEVEGRSHLTLARDIQRHPVRNTVAHIDFQIVRRDEVITAEVPVVLVGEPVEVNHGDGIVDQLLFTLSVKARPSDIPSSVDLDISSLTIGSSLHVSDIALAAGVEVDIDPDTPVVSGIPPRVQTAGEEGAAAEGEATSGSAEAQASEH